MATITINPQFDILDQLLEKDYIGVNEDFTPFDDHNLFFYQLQQIEDRNIIETLPVMETVCGFNVIKSFTKFCIEIPKITYTYDNGTIVKTIETIDTITGNTWINEIKEVLDFETIRTKLTELRSISDVFYQKIKKSGMDYTAKADMSNTYVCNSLALMRGVGNLFLTLHNQAFIYPTYTEAYAGYDTDGNYTGIPNSLIFKGLAQQNPGLPQEDGLLSNYTNMLDNFLDRLSSFTAIATELDKITFLTTLAPLPNSIDYNQPPLTLADLKASCQHHVSNILDNIETKILLVQDCLSVVDYFDKILKIISTVAIVYNTSNEANALQQVLLKGSDDNTLETKIAYDNAFDTKWSYSQAEMAIGIMVATRKTLNYFNYHNIFETILDKVFEQGIKQYDKITT